MQSDPKYENAELTVDLADEVEDDDSDRAEFLREFVRQLLTAKKESDTDYDMTDVLDIGETDPARQTRPRGSFVTDTVIDRPALPHGRGPGHRKA